MISYDRDTYGVAWSSITWCNTSSVPRPGTSVERAPRPHEPTRHAARTRTTRAPARAGARRREGGAEGGAPPTSHLEI